MHRIYGGTNEIMCEIVGRPRTRFIAWARGAAAVAIQSAFDAFALDTTTA